MAPNTAAQRNALRQYYHHYGLPAPGNYQVYIQREALKCSERDKQLSKQLGVTDWRDVVRAYMTPMPKELSEIFPGIRIDVEEIINLTYALLPTIPEDVFRTVKSGSALERLLGIMLLIWIVVPGPWDALSPFLAAAYSGWRVGSEETVGYVVDAALATGLLAFFSRFAVDVLGTCRDIFAADFKLKPFFARTVLILGIWRYLHSKYPAAHINEQVGVGFVEAMVDIQFGRSLAFGGYSSRLIAAMTSAEADKKLEAQMEGTLYTYRVFNYLNFGSVKRRLLATKEIEAREIARSTLVAAYVLLARRFSDKFSIAWIHKHILGDPAVLSARPEELERLIGAKLEKRLNIGRSASYYAQSRGVYTVEGTAFSGSKVESLINLRRTIAEFYRGIYGRQQASLGNKAASLLSRLNPFHMRRPSPASA